MTEPITIVIADDEPLVRKGIRHILSNHKSFEVVGEASNGLEAVGMIRRYLPKIVLMDVKMPVQDGLTALQHIRDLKLSVIPVILSGYSDFAYAQRALKLGVYEYVLKPTDPEELLRVLDGLKQTIMQEEEQKDIESKLKTQLSYGMPAFMERFYRKLLMDEYLPAEFEEEIKILEIQQNHALVLLLSPDNCYQLKTINSKEDYLELYSRMRMCLQEFLNQGNMTSMPVLQTDKDYFILILYTSLKLDVLQFSMQMKAWMKRETGISFSVAIGTEQDLSNLSASYQSAASRLKQRLMIGRDAIIDHDVIRQGDDSEYLADMLKKLENVLRLGDRKQVQAYLNDMIEKIVTAGNFTPDNWSRLCFDLLEIGYRVAKEFKILRLISVVERVLEISELSTETDIRIWFTSYFDEILGKMNEVSVSPSMEIKEALSYIEEHFAENLTLTMVAAHVGLSPNYLSQMFRHATGKTFLEHLTCCRLKEAKKLLGQSGLNISEISFRVGYDNQRYFSQIFIKQEGITPSAYRKTIR